MSNIYQTVLVLSTRKSDLRSEVIGWMIDSGAIAYAELARRKKAGQEPNKVNVGLIPGCLDWYAYPTVLHALAEGFRLLAPPTEYKKNNETEYSEWWLVREDRSPRVI